MPWVYRVVLTKADARTSIRLAWQSGVGSNSGGEGEGDGGGCGGGDGARAGEEMSEPRQLSAGFQ